MFKKILYYYNKFKLTLIRTFLNFPVNRDVKRGFIIIQIDGLSYDTLNLAIKRNYLPNLKKVLKTKGFISKKFYSGLPSSTPSFQKSIMFGDDEKIPGFRWFDKKNKKYYTFKNPETSELIEKQVKEKGLKGILKGGVSYFNFFSGDADRSYLTMSKILTVNLKSKISGIKIFMMIILNIFNLAVLLYRSFKELAKEFFDLLYYYFNEMPQRTFLFFPFLRIFNNVILNEYITQGVCFEIICGTPKIYVTFNAYDELAHQRGSESRSALNILKIIDKSIAKILFFGLNFSLRKYDFYILSDHGSARSFPFFKLFRKELKEAIFKYKEHIIEEKFSNTIKSVSINIAILKKIENLSKSGEIPKIFYKFFPILRLDKGKKKKIYENFQPKDINIISFGPVAHIYFATKSKKLNFEQINREYPYLIIDILSHKGIGAIIVLDKDDVLIILKDFFARIKNGHLIEGKLPEFIKEQHLIDIEKIAQLDSSGDLIIISNFINSQILNFEDQMSCHGGIGYGQTEAFLIYPSVKDKFINKINSPVELHYFFKENYI